MKRVVPTAGQESVWDYPRPPRVEDCSSEIKVVFGRQLIAQTRRAKRVLETSHPPIYYIPVDDVRQRTLLPSGRTTVCEWKGTARYFHVMLDDATADNAAWSYDRPMPGFEAIAGHIAFYPHRMDDCYVDGERVQAQRGGFYGGWITKNIVGPFKGEIGTQAW